jgi:hypothetical protein
MGTDDKQKRKERRSDRTEFAVATAALSGAPKV